VVTPSFHIRVGIDILAVERVSRLLRENAGIEDEVFTPRELAYCRGRSRPDEHLAARFAAKEAVLKVIGTGLSRRLRWTDVEILRDGAGRPEVQLHGRVAEFAGTRGISGIDVSLSHSGGMAVAQAAAVCDATGGGALCAST
jgi:holo-[acyl-carrier protein] synthase